ncbi:MAG: hypothetical protein R3F37_08915 [Candidatus Competibacteraceae bacterium]
MQSPEGATIRPLMRIPRARKAIWYIWTPEQVQSLLSPEEYAVFAPRFDWIEATRRSLAFADL